jgi:hypothetical protein
MWSYPENEVDGKFSKAVVDIRQTLSEQAEKLGKQAWATPLPRHGHSSSRWELECGGG